MVFQNLDCDSIVSEKKQKVCIKEYKEEGQCAQKWGRMLVFVIYGIIKNVLPNSYFILQSFTMMHFMSLYFNFSFSWKYIEKLIELRLLSNYYPDQFL